MNFKSILFPYQEDKNTELAEECPFFRDLNIDLIIDAICKEREKYNLIPFFRIPLRDIRAIQYRQEVMKDMEDEQLSASIERFTESMAEVFRYLESVEDLDFVLNKRGWYLEAILLYCATVKSLARAIEEIGPGSDGFLGFSNYLKQYVRSEAFQKLHTEAKNVKKQLSAIKYCVIVQYGKFYVKRYENEVDYSIEIEKTFEKFKQHTSKSYLSDIPERNRLTHVEAKILEFVALLYPEAFASLEHFCNRYKEFMDEIIERFYREIQFYVAYLSFVSKIKGKGLNFTYPQVSSSREVHVRDGFDMALACMLVESDEPLICNDFSLHDPERIIVVTGPNQGGKTTFARMFGQLHYFSRLGCPVPGTEAHLFLCDNIFTHFEKEEDIRSLRGKLQDDLIRIHDILAHSTSNSILILNEIFTSTSLSDAVFLSRKILERVIEKDSLCVWVTFIDELSKMSEKTVSMVSTVDPENPSIRTYKIVKKPADGLAYALSIAEKHRLSYRQVKERIRK